MHISSLLGQNLVLMAMVIFGPIFVAAYIGRFGRAPVGNTILTAITTAALFSLDDAFQLLMFYW